MSNDKLETSLDLGESDQPAPVNPEALQRLVHEYRLDIDTTLDQFAVWIKSKNFGKHQSTLLSHFFERLEKSFNLFPVQDLVVPVTEFTIPCQPNWTDIAEFVDYVLMKDMGDSLIDTQDELTKALGFPPDTYADMIECIEKGRAMESKAH
jgi:hypothetical protein